MQEYLEELANAAYTKIDAAAWANAGEIKRHIPVKPTDAAELARTLARNPALQATLASLTGYTPSKWLLKHELDEVRQRRVAQEVRPIAQGDDPYRCASEMGLMGLCLSGGGIRSATFNLGILQALAELGLLRCFDYLSSVSGGGYVHQFLAGWIHRKGFDHVKEELIPQPEQGCPPTQPEPIRWLRRYSNYLTPQLGVFSGDTWVTIATWIRNAVLNQAILCTSLLALLLFIVRVPSLSSRFMGGPATAAAIALLFALFIAASGFAGGNLLHFGGPEEEGRRLRYSRVQVTVIAPLLISASIAAMLIPLIAGDLVGLRLLVTFIVGSVLLFVLAVTLAFGGGAHLGYLHTTLGATGFKSFAEFWRQKPKCGAHLKALFASAGFVIAGMVAALCGAAWIVATEYGLLRLWHPAARYWVRLVFIGAPPLILSGALLTILLLTGLLGRSYFDSKKEWLARLSGWLMLYSIVWIVVTGIALFSYIGAVRLWPYTKSLVGAGLAWLCTTVGGVLAANSSKSSGATDAEQSGKASYIELLAAVAPYVFIGGLLVLISIAAEWISLRSSGWEVLLTIVMIAAISLVLAWRVDINEFSMHAFYRNRLARCYLGASNASRQPDPFTGFDDRDAAIALSRLRVANQYHGPFPIFCTALNLTFGQDLAWQERKACSFAFTPLYSGYDVPWTASSSKKSMLRFNGYSKTETYAFSEPGIHLSTACAISGAAVSPNQGYHSNPATAFLLTVFNVRLGAWLANPRALTESGRLIRSDHDLLGDDCPEPGRSSYPAPSPKMSLFYLAFELLGQANDTRRYINLSDGGHFDNMGLYELVRRRCRFIVISDAEQDGQLKFEGIGMAIRKCRIDFGAEIALDLRALQHAEDTSSSSAHCVAGTVRYPDDPAGTAPGIVVYIKSSLTGDEPGDVLNYKKQDAVFPDDSTVNQWFSESQFESYRRLGHHVGLSCFQPAAPEAFSCADGDGRKQYFSNMRKIWVPATPEMTEFSAKHSSLYSDLMERIRIDPKLSGLFDPLFTRRVGSGSNAVIPSPNDDDEYVIRFCSSIIEFIFILYLQLRLTYPENRDHPFAQGWLDIFADWLQVDLVNKAWKRYGPSYAAGFQVFVESEIIHHG